MLRGCCGGGFDFLLPQQVREAVGQRRGAAGMCWTAARELRRRVRGLARVSDVTRTCRGGPGVRESPTLSCGPKLGGRSPEERPLTQLVRILPRCWHNPCVGSDHAQNQGGSNGGSWDGTLAAHSGTGKRVNRHGGDFLSERRTAKKKSAHHETLWRSEQEGTLRTVLESDIAHFKKVGLWWYVLFWGAVSTTLAEEVLDYLAFVSP